RTYGAGARPQTHETAPETSTARTFPRSARSRALGRRSIASPSARSRLSLRRAGDILLVGLRGLDHAGDRLCKRRDAAVLVDQRPDVLHVQIRMIFTERSPHKEPRVLHTAAQHLR